MVELLTHEQILLFKELFNLYDKDGDGELSSEELGTVMNLLCKNLTETELQAMMNVPDYNNNWKVTFAQFLDVVAREVKATVSEKELKEAFRFLDKDNKGFITAMDLRHSMTSLGENLTEEEVNETLRKSDVKGNRQVNYEEFMKMMTEK